MLNFQNIVINDCVIRHHLQYISAAWSSYCSHDNRVLKKCSSLLPHVNTLLRRRSICIFDYWGEPQFFNYFNFLKIFHFIKPLRRRKVRQENFTISFLWVVGIFMAKWPPYILFYSNQMRKKSFECPSYSNASILLFCRWWFAISDPRLWPALSIKWVKLSPFHYRSTPTLDGYLRLLFSIFNYSFDYLLPLIVWL